MVPDPEKTCLGLEYFVFENDGLWSMADKDLVALAKSEIEKLGISSSANVVDGVVLRVRKAYPVYDATYKEKINVIKNYLSRFENLQVVGRNGMHKYNNQDHSMITAMLAVKNILGENNDLWSINADLEYLEEHRLHKGE